MASYALDDSPARSAPPEEPASDAPPVETSQPATREPAPQLLPAAARNLWKPLAISLLVVNLIGNAATAVLRGDPRTLIGVPIAGGLIAYLLSSPVRGAFGASNLHP